MWPNSSCLAFTVFGAVAFTLGAGLTAVVMRKYYSPELTLNVTTETNTEQ